MVPVTTHRRDRDRKGDQGTEERLEGGGERNRERGPSGNPPIRTQIERQAGSGRKRAKAEELPRRRCSHLSLVHPKSAFSTQQERQPISRRPELVCSTPLYVTPIQPGSEAHFAIFIMVVEAWDFSLSDSLVLKDARLLASWYSVEQVTKRGGRKQRGKPSRSLCHGSLPRSGSPSLKMATRKLVQWRDAAVLVARETRIPEMRNSGRAHAGAVGRQPGVPGPDREEVGRSWLGRAVAEAPPRPGSSGDGVAGRGRWGCGDWSRRGRGSHDWRRQAGVGGLGAQGGRPVEAPAPGKGDRSPPLPLATPLPGTRRPARGMASPGAGSQSGSPALLPLRRST